MDDKTYIVLGVEEREIKHDIVVCHGLASAIITANDMLRQQINTHNKPDSKNTQWATEYNLAGFSNQEPKFDVYELNPEDFTNLYNLMDENQPESETTIKPEIPGNIKCKTIHIGPKDRLKKNGRKRTTKQCITKKVNRFIKKMHDQRTPIRIINIETKTEIRSKHNACSTSDTEQHTILNIWYEEINHA